MVRVDESERSKAIALKAIRGVFVERDLHIVEELTVAQRLRRCAGFTRLAPAAKPGHPAHPRYSTRRPSGTKRGRVEPLADI